MAIVISGPGVGLPPPQNLYPTELYNAPDDFASNYQTLNAGDAIQLPATGVNGWVVDTGSYSFLQWLDPVTGIWRTHNPTRPGPMFVTSDGFTRRVVNLTGCVASAIVKDGGSNWVQSTTTITANVGGSTWAAVVGGSLSVSTVTAAGSGYTMAPLVLIPAPPAGGIQATAYATIASGTVSSVSLVNFGAGYTTAPKAVILPSPFDPNINSISQASVTLVLNAANASVITGALCTNNGAPLSTISALTLTASGGSGTGATITPVVIQTVASATVAAGGGGWGVAAVPALVTTAGGVPTSTSAIVNPAIEMTGFKPRPAIINVTTSASGGISAPVITDGGLFAGTATPVIIPGGTLPTTLASVTLVMGSTQDTVLVQPL